MKEKNGLSLETAISLEELATQSGFEDAILEDRAEHLFAILQEVEELADDLTDEQFCGLVHQAVTSCGFTDAVDAWFSLLALTERKIGTLDLRDFLPKSPDTQS
ncbi:MAG TPA: hypothetical protein VJQ82_21150 [Terriglobales bacterium]|nr:hypothetical protein [Terriglobales bacterium]